MKSLNLKCPIIAVANQKGGVGKTTTTVNLAHALTLRLPPHDRILVIDFDPQGNTTQASGIKLETVRLSISDLIKDRSLADDAALYKEERIDLIPATHLLSQLEREMIGMTNSELRLAQRLSKLRERYSVILIDTPPTFGPLMNSSLNAASKLIIPVDSGFFALMGIKELSAEMEEIRRGTNPDLEVLGYLLTLVDPTNMASQTWDTLVASFGELVFETKIRRSVKLREAPAFGKTIFHHAPESAGAKDYLSLANEVMARLGIGETSIDLQHRPALSLVAGVAHE